MNLKFSQKYIQRVHCRHSTHRLLRPPMKPYFWNFRFLHLGGHLISDHFQTLMTEASSAIDIPFVRNRHRLYRAAKLDRDHCCHRRHKKSFCTPHHSTSAAPEDSLRVCCLCINSPNSMNTPFDDDMDGYWAVHFHRIRLDLWIRPSNIRRCHCVGTNAKWIVNSSRLQRQHRYLEFRTIVESVLSCQSLRECFLLLRACRSAWCRVHGEVWKLHACTESSRSSCIEMSLRREFYLSRLDRERRYRCYRQPPYDRNRMQPNFGN